MLGIHRRPGGDMLGIHRRPSSEFHTVSKSLSDKKQNV